MTTDDTDDLQRVKRVLEVLHGNHLYTAYTERDATDHLAKAVAVENAITTIEMIDDDMKHPAELMLEIDDTDDTGISAGKLRELSRHDREGGSVGRHSLVERENIKTEPRSLLQLMKEYSPL